MDNLELGKKIRAFRTAKKMNIKDLAAASGVTPSMLSQIERDLVNPSINTLKAVARALDVPMYRFFQEDETHSGDLVVRAGGRKRIGIPGSDVTYELLTASVNGDIEFCMMGIPPGLNGNAPAQNHQGEEVALVLDGEVDLHVGNSVLALNTGDSVRIPAGQDHWWVNHTDTPVQVVFAVTPPSF